MSVSWTTYKSNDFYDDFVCQILEGRHGRGMSLTSVVHVGLKVKGKYGDGKIFQTRAWSSIRHFSKQNDYLSFKICYE